MASRLGSAAMAGVGMILLAGALSGMTAAGANAPNPQATTTGTATLNADGTVSVTLSGTWTWPGQTCAGRYGEGVAVDWWGLSSSATVSPSFSLLASVVSGVNTISTATVAPVGAVHKGSGPYFHVGQYYSGQDVNSAGTCTDNGSGGSSGPWSASATYSSITQVPTQLCANLYDEHGQQGKPSSFTSNDFSPVKDDDNSIDTNNFNPSVGAGYCVSLHVAAIAGHIYECVGGATQTTTEVSGGTLSATGPQSVGSTTNPLGPVSVASGAYTMSAMAPSGWMFTPCGGSALVGSPPTTATEAVTVPVDGTGTGIFYVGPVPTVLTMVVTKTNDANGSGTYAQSETATSAGQAVPFRAVVTNTSSVAVTITSLTDVWPAGTSFSPTCATTVTGVTLPPGQSVVCDFTVAGYSPAAGTSLTDTVTVTGCQASDNTTCASWTATSIVTTATQVAVAAAGAGATPATAALAFTGPPSHLRLLLVLGMSLMSVGFFLLWYTRPRRLEAYRS